MHKIQKTQTIRAINFSDFRHICALIFNHLFEWLCFFFDKLFLENLTKRLDGGGNSLYIFHRIEFIQLELSISNWRRNADEKHCLRHEYYTKVMLHF